MENHSSTSKNIYYTDDHEWIDYYGTIAYVGICKFKLTGFKQVETILFINSKDDLYMKKGEIIATITYKDYQIHAHMPVDGKVIQINKDLFSDPNILISNPETLGWISQINPSKPYDRDELMLPKKYQMIVKSKYSKF
jgi:glycine cleavage system H protein